MITQSLLLKKEKKLIINGNQRLAWMCSELKKQIKFIVPGQIRGINKFRRTMNERPRSVDHESEIKALCADLILKERDKTA